MLLNAINYHFPCYITACIYKSNFLLPLKNAQKNLGNRLGFLLYYSAGEITICRFGSEPLDDVLTFL